MAKKNQRKKTEKRSSRLAIIGITVVVASMAVVLNLKVSDLKEKDSYYRQREEVLAEQIEDQEVRAETLEEYRIYVQTKEYIEKIAKEKLGLVNEDEILLKPN